MNINRISFRYSDTATHTRRLFRVIFDHFVNSKFGNMWEIVWTNGQSTNIIIITIDSQLAAFCSLSFVSLSSGIRAAEKARESNVSNRKCRIILWFTKEIIIYFSYYNRCYHWIISCACVIEVMTQNDPTHHQTNLLLKRPPGVPAT